MLLTIDNLSPRVVVCQHYVCPVHHLVGIAEIAEMLGVSRQRVHKIVQTHEDFPAPEADLTAGRIWKRSEVIQWAHANGRTVSGTDD